MTRRTPPAGSDCWDRAFARGDGELRYAFARRHVVPYIEFYPKPGQARAVQIDLDPARIGLRYPVEVGLAGDAHVTLELLEPTAQTPARKRSFGKSPGRDARLEKVDEERGTRRDTPMKPQVVAWEIGKQISDTAIVSCDSGTITTWFAAPDSRPPRSDAFAFRNTGDDGARTALRDRGPSRLSGATEHRVCRRRRIHDADGRVCDGRKIQAADQSLRDKK